ncbi:FBP domain-containing protein [Cryptosporangium aurantiacum]|uniref:FBP C-terminal treble-clef zinc-finger n=1 Tax=Cryptosporangium aurantiacum TaxID=134849 RepID=A0A1M7RB35_9ACTN|nr:FBP domain-containing protein [Cryptosporangium aurantiacum]SHN43507.1 FBP C-terminal treble-clef zinc-finger [Cryptosporangium aurantiacum]
MRRLTEKEIRGSFVNCSKGEATRLPMPRDLDTRPWDDLDFLGWSDLSAPDRSYLVAERGNARQGDALVGIVLRSAAGQRGYLRRSLCSFCLTQHPGSGVALMTARKTGAAGRQGNSVGTYVCSDLACSLYLRGRKKPAVGGRIEESLTVEDQVARVRMHLESFLDSLDA